MRVCVNSKNAILREQTETRSLSENNEMSLRII